ncbi:MAG: PKD domain-containing protein [Chitinophagaceae bacterium]|nr:PKD domain-containing protein [Chitinophagaceae bacterium]
MKKYFILIALSFITVKEIYANHTKGGWMYYEYLGPGTIDPSKLKYKIGLNLYIDCGSILIEPTWNFSFFTGRAPYNFIQDITVNAAPDYLIDGCVTITCYPCINNVPSRCYKIINYETIVELAATPEGYIVSKERCCRIAGISNIAVPSNNYGATYTIKIPGTLEAPTAPMNTSPVFIFNDTAVVCGNNPFTLNFTATDANSDSLVYSFVDAYAGANSGAPNPGTATNPPYATVPYQAPYTGSQPLGAGVTIDPVTGVISGIAPPPGEYVICVLVKEYKNGVYIGESRKELHLKTAPCTPLVASSNFTPITCDGFTVNFTQNSSGSPTTFLWDFDDPASGAANTSNLPNPTHTFTAAGIFNIKLVVSISGQCIDSITKPIGVYPGFFPGFITSAPLCAGSPIQFTDTSRTNYGVVDSWRWDFGDLVVLNDTSHLQNPVYTYNPGGVYTVQLKVTNSKGCEKTVDIPITIHDIPALSVFPADSVYCALDSLQLTGTGVGTFNWTPNTNIFGANTATPLVFPPVPTRYYAKLTSVDGCSKTDSVFVRPLNDLTNAIAGPINICEEDTVTLTGSSNHASNISWQWGPPGTIETPLNSTTRVYPIVNTTYTLLTRWGNNCVATKTHTINVKPLAIPNAGPDGFVCAGGQTFTQLNASGGDSYQWTPVTGLSNPNIPNPIASPTIPTFYVVAVGVTGCPKLRTDTVFIDVGLLPLISTLNDTLICNIDTLQLTTTGTGSFNWSPNYMISSTTVASPLVSPDVPTWYYVQLTDAIGCQSRDSVFVDVKDHVTLGAGPDTTICQTDGFRLNSYGDALHYIWTPNTWLDFDNIKQPFTRPLSTITYHVIGNIGKCQTEDDVTIKVVPYPAANAGPDLALCPGFNAQLNATGGSRYVWSPVNFLNNRFIPNPISIRPPASIQYIVTVSDTLGCPKSVKDTVFVKVYPKAIANAGPSDTTVVKGEPLHLKASGGISYLWTPATWLNSNTIVNPTSLPEDNIRYYVEVTTADGCVAIDSINVWLYNMNEDIYVPSAFTPNGDGKNDVLRPILLGMADLSYFKVFNRFGELVYQTTEKGAGWDGNYKGKGQDPATFVWVAEGVTYKGIIRRKKGYAVLIR